MRSDSNSVGLVALACWATVSLTACGSSHAIKPLSPRNAPGGLRDVFHPHRFAAKEVKAAFAKQGIRLREVRAQPSHVVVLFDPRRQAPTKAQLRTEAPAQPYIWVFLHSTNDNRCRWGMSTSATARARTSAASTPRSTRSTAATSTRSLPCGSARECHSTARRGAITKAMKRALLRHPFLSDRGLKWSLLRLPFLFLSCTVVFGAMMYVGYRMSGSYHNGERTVGGAARSGAALAAVCCVLSILGATFDSLRRVVQTRWRDRNSRRTRA